MLRRRKKSVLFAALWVLMNAHSLQAASVPVKFKRHGGQIDVSIGGKPFTSYYFSEMVSKPYFQPLRTALGTIVTRGFPVFNNIPRAHEHDRNLEPHQRPMFFGHGNINGYDFWAEEAFAGFYGSDGHHPYGRQVFHSIDEIRGGSDSGTLTATFDLMGPDGKRFAQEKQSFTFRGDAMTRTIDCSFTVTAGKGPVTMGDSKEGTFAIRVAPDLTGAKVRMLNSNGKVGEKQIWGKRANWVDYSGTVSDEQVGIAVFDNPQNLRHPTTWHARDYGLFAANPFGESYFYNDKNRDGSYTIEPGESLTLRYRVLIHHGDWGAAQLNKAYLDYARPL